MVDGDGKHGKKLRYTAFQRMAETRQRRHQRILQKEKQKCGIAELEATLSDHDSKTVNYDRFKEYLLQRNKLSKDLVPFYARPLFRKMRWRQFVYTIYQEE
jgi:hypothetical protein